MKLLTFSVLVCLFSSALGATVRTNAPCQDSVYVGGPNGQFAFSHDGGETWTQRSSSGRYGEIYSILSTEYGHVTIGAGSAVLTTKNDGVTWNEHGFNNFALAIVANTTNSISVLNSVGNVRRSSDGGDTWPEEFVLPGLGYTSLIIKGQKYYAWSDGQGLLFSDASTNFGSWPQINVGFSIKEPGWIAGDGTNIFVGLDLDGAPLILSNDDFASKTIALLDPLGKNNGITALAVAPNAIYAALRNVGVAVAPSFYSEWSIKNTADGLANNNVVQLAATSNGCAYAATSEGLSISHDGGQTWITKTTQSGLPTNSITAVYAKPLA